MATATTLSIRGYRDEPVPNRFLHPQEAHDQLAILLPGLGYTLDMPLFYYTENLLLERGWDVLRVEYAYNTRPEFQTMPEPERARWLLEDATAAYRAGLAQGEYKGLILGGKSLGTVAMGHLLTMDKPTVPVRAIWLTPLLGQERLREQITRYGGPSLFVIGAADPHYDPVILDELCRATNGESVVVEGADHGMDIEGDPVASVRALELVVDELVRFLR
jgi:predicted alpha/beta-hydrolase family hydrolase